MNNGSPNPKKLADFAETDAIRKLLGGVTRRGGKAPEPTPESAPTPADAHAPTMAFVGDDSGTVELAEMPPPLPSQIELPSPVTAPPLPPTPESPEPMPAEPRLNRPRDPEPDVPPPVPQPIGALGFGELLLRMNWRNRPDAVEPLPLIGVPQPAGFADSVEGVLSVFNWDDE